MMHFGGMKLYNKWKKQNWCLKSLLSTMPSFLTRITLSSLSEYLLAFLSDKSPTMIISPSLLRSEITK